MAASIPDRLMQTTPHLDDLLPYLMNRLIARMNQNLADTLRAHGFTFQDWRILAVLAAHNGINLTELTEAAVLPQPTVSRLVAQLARKGLVDRRNAKKDSRFVELWITPSGLKTYRRMLPHAVAEYRAAMKGFSAKDGAHLRRMLQRMMRNRDVTLLPRISGTASPPRSRRPERTSPSARRP
jgi:DNA-binding MarR family transcriptional regulator